MSATDVTHVVHPGTGEVLERLDEQPPETLAEALHVIHARQDELKRWGEAIDVELRRRLKLRQTRLAVFGEWEVEASIRRESVWDPDELEPALQQLVADGTILAGDVADLIETKREVKRSRAKALLGRLTDDAYDAVAVACTWREKPGPLTIAKSVQLPSGAEQASPGAAPAQVPAGTAQPSTPPAPTLDPQELFA